MTISAARTSRAAVVLVAAVCAASLVPDPAAWRELVAPRSGALTHVDDLAALLAGAALWLVAVWVLAVAVLAAIASLPGYAGRCGRLLVGAAVPRVLRGVVLGGIAGGLVLGPTFAAGATPVRPSSAATVAASAVATPGPAWPTGEASSTTPGPRWPTSPPVDSGPADSGPADPRSTDPPTHPPADAPRTVPPSSEPSPTTPPVHPPATPTTPTSPTSPTSTAPGATAVVVRPGDSLWSITASALTPTGGAAPTDRQVAAAWPAWFAVNRAVIGPDPGLLQPGTHLTPPITDGSTP